MKVIDEATRLLLMLVIYINSNPEVDTRSFGKYSVNARPCFSPVTNLIKPLQS